MLKRNVLMVLALGSASAMSPIRAFASQGPGGGPGSAGHLTQLAMAIVVYGGCALIVAAGLIGGLRAPPR